jgi:lipopolysaccharide/colanic/teichoic acid biosynthesis glycosyltransferase
MTAAPLSSEPSAERRELEPVPDRTHSAVTSRIKRSFDVAVSSATLALLAPLLAAIAFVIRRTSPGPALFRQDRVGHQGQSFEVLKFRTMAVDNDDSAHRELCIRQLTDGEATAETSDGAFKLESDPRVTPVGQWLRRFSLDEVPQLINVLRGDMSIVGPRPALSFEADLYRLEHRRRLDVRPGLTGLWQTSGRNRLSMLEMLDLDVSYVDRWSHRLDLEILLRTPLVLIRGDGAR